MSTWISKTYHRAFFLVVVGRTRVDIGLSQILIAVPPDPIASQGHRKLSSHPQREPHVVVRNRGHGSESQAKWPRPSVLRPNPAAWIT